MFKSKKIILISLISLSLLGLFLYIPQTIYKQKEILVTENSKTTATFLKINGESHEDVITGQMSVYDFMSKLRNEGKINFTEKNYIGIGKMIVAINGIEGAGNQNWIYYVNGALAQVGVSNYKIKGGDTVSWKYEKSIY